MRRVSKFGLLAFVVMALSLSAFAGSVSSFEYSPGLNQANIETIQAPVTFNTTNAYARESFAFEGTAFNGVSTTTSQTLSGTLLDQIGGGNMPSNQKTVVGVAVGWPKAQAPEGGSAFVYLGVAGLLLFGTILFTGKRRRSFQV